MPENLRLGTPDSLSGEPEPLSLATPGIGLLFGCAIAGLTIAGCLGFYRDLLILWTVWTTDPLRSVGMLVPPVSVILTLRVWRQHGWQMRGTWWGLAVIALSYLLCLLRQRIVLMAIFGQASASLIPISLPLYVYGSGIVLLFAGVEVWRKAWFPIGLLLLSQPVPVLANGMIDIPLQNISARVARSFATFIHFAPTTPQLQLMFSPDFGMFIAPGCDGIRGAVAMGYVALILGYLKRFTWYAWFACVVCAVLLGYLFNFIRLCVLVVYYRVALGHPALENVAKQADYLIGTCLFLVATFLFVWIASRRHANAVTQSKGSTSARDSLRTRNIAFRCGAFAALLLAALAIPSSALNSVRTRKFDANSFAALMPKQVDGFNLTRTWYEQQNGVPVVQAGAYASLPGSDEVMLAVWIAPHDPIHDAGACWLARGLEPELLNVRSFPVAGGKSVQLNTGFYSDGVTDSIVVNAMCTPETCALYQGTSSKSRFGLVFLGQRVNAIAGSEQHPVSIMVRIDRLHSNGLKTLTQGQLLSEAQQFLVGLDLTALSRAFQ